MRTIVILLWALLALLIFAPYILLARLYGYNDFLSLVGIETLLIVVFGLVIGALGKIYNNLKK